MRISSGWMTEETRALTGRRVRGQANVQSELDGVTRNRSIYARTFLSLETLNALCILRNRRKSHSNTSSTETRRETIDGRDASLLSMVELLFFTRRTARA